MNQAERVVDAIVRLHAKVSLIALSGLGHLRVALAGTVLAGTGSRDNGGVYNAASAQPQAVLLQVFFKQCIAKTLLLHGMPEVENGSLARQAVRLQTDEVPHGFDLVQSISVAGSLRL